MTEMSDCNMTDHHEQTGKDTCSEVSGDPVDGPDAAGAEGVKADKDQAVQVDAALLRLLICPVSRGGLTHDAKAHELISKKAGLAYPIRKGIPIMLESEARVIE